MLSDDSLAGPLLPDTTRHSRRLRPAVLASVLLHVALAAAIGSGAIALSPPVDAIAERNAVAVSLALQSPQRRTMPPEPELPEEATPELPVQETALPEPAAEAPADSPVDAPSDSPTESIDEAVAEATPDSESGASDDALPALDVNRLQESISNSMLTYRRDVLVDQMQECQQYRDRYDRWDCPGRGEVKSAMQERIDDGMDATFRAYVYGHDRNRRISAELLADMDALRPLMEDSGVLGTLARQRYDVMAVQYDILNPGAFPADMLTRGAVIGGPNLGGNVGLVSFGGNGIVILNGLMTIGFNGKISFDQEPAPAFDEGDEECALPPSPQGQRSGGCW